MDERFDRFARAVDGFDRHVQTIGGAQWHDETPDDDWDVRMLVNHVAVEQLWVPPLLDGATVADIGDRFDGDQLGDDPAGGWSAAVDASRAAFGSDGALDGTVQLSAGPKSVAEYCWEMTVDALIHSWDLARAIGGDEALDAELVELTYESILPIADQLQATGMYAAPVLVSADADLQTRLLALFGRRA
jgi:uncharacterized protein (TIGR03086 family)